ncbi:membrane protein insertase YidC [Phenylobacterium sp.]|uniref:membrane protein insertase YidC n=1 Tax=Phenylobacterium sp. TaxID=1871053 RepID=UPI00273129A9|nr:membrane protein insertase YidC [Phenylobacterium sp.]MDP1601180.1 membrane protein insertase YidC [Phenylobacterium sp.]MDP3591767.1 membrane protein insertase YidC [Phenylobacterium sp.]
MQENNNRNTIIFVVSAVLILIAYQFLVVDPATKRRNADMVRQKAATVETQKPGVLPSATPGTVVVSREQAAAASTRAPITTPALSGSVSLRGARIDDLFLKNYRQTVDKTSPPVELLRPEGSRYAYFAEFGWTGANLPGLPTADTVWQLVEGSTLAPGQPLTLRTSTGQGLTFTRKIEVDDRFMFTVTDTVANTGTGSVTLAPYGSVQRQGIPAGLGKIQIVHEGAIGWLGDELRQVKYAKWLKDGGGSPITSTGGWTGITDKYWLAAMIPDQKERIQSQYRVTKAGATDIYEANYIGQPRVIPAGRQITETTRLFAGAKTVPVLKDYETKLGVPHFDMAVDWGNFWFITRPMFAFLDFIFRHVGNFGIAILLLTVAVKLIFFPLANKSYESLTKMKKVQPQVEELRKRLKDDPAKQQQELMALYQKEKINPLTGCLPMLVQIPVFYGLYKVLTVTIEMRHAPFFGWIQDLSARDPLTIWNLFGLLPYNPATVPVIGGFLNSDLLHLGPLALLYGVTMYLSTAMNPPQADPVQQKIFQFMPIMFTFIMAPFAVGLLIYWAWSNVLTILQQYLIMRRFKVDNPIDQIIAKLTGKKSKIA